MKQVNNGKFLPCRLQWRNCPVLHVAAQRGAAERDIAKAHIGRESRMVNEQRIFVSSTGKRRGQTEVKRTAAFQKAHFRLRS
jgi:hypothetical protein